jgi:hypothetical protein
MLPGYICITNTPNLNGINLKPILPIRTIARSCRRGQLRGLERAPARGDVREDPEFECIVNVQRYGPEGQVFVTDQRAAAG